MVVRRLHERNLHARTPAKKKYSDARACSPAIGQTLSLQTRQCFRHHKKPPYVKCGAPTTSRFLGLDEPGEFVQVSPPKINARAYLQILGDVLKPYYILKTRCRISSWSKITALSTPPTMSGSGMQIIRKSFY